MSNWMNRRGTLGQLEDFDPGIGSQPLTQIQSFESLPGAPAPTVVAAPGTVQNPVVTFDASGGQQRQPDDFLQDVLIPGGVEDEDPETQKENGEKESGGFPVVPVAIGAGVLLVVGAIVLARR